MYISEIYSDIFLLDSNPEIFMECYLEEFSLDPLIDLKNKIAILMKDLGNWTSNKLSAFKMIKDEIKNLSRSLIKDIKSGFIGQASEKIKLALLSLIEKFKKLGKISKILIGIVIALFILLLCLFLFTTFPIGGYIIILTPVAIWVYNRFKQASNIVNRQKEIISQGDISPIVEKSAEKIGVNNKELLRFVTGGQKSVGKNLEAGFLKALDKKSESENLVVSITATVIKSVYDAITSLKF